MSTISFRPCVSEDVEKAVPLILSSGPTAFAYVFDNNKNTATDFLTYAFVRKGGEFSHDNHYAVILDNELIGIGAVFSSDRASSFTFCDFKNIVGFYNFKSFLPIIHGLKIEHIIRLPKKNEICLAHIAIHKSQRGRGYGRQLMNFLMGKQKIKQHESYVLDVSEENPRAKALYEGMGFTVGRKVPSKLKNKHGYVANHFRMVYSDVSGTKES